MENLKKIGVVLLMLLVLLPSVSFMVRTLRDDDGGGDISPSLSGGAEYPNLEPTVRFGGNNYLTKAFPIECIENSTSISLTDNYIVVPEGNSDADAYAEMLFSPFGSYSPDPRDYSYLTIDFDIVSDGNVVDCVFFVVGREDSLNPLVVEDSKFRLNKNGDTLNLILNSDDDNIIEKSEATIRVTYVIKVDHSELSHSELAVYVDGELLALKENIFDDSLAYIEGVRVNSFGSSGGRIGFANLNVNTFDIGYTGAISKLFEERITLSECADIKRF